MARTMAEMVRGAFDRARGRTALVRFLTTSGGFDVYSVGSTASVDTSYAVTVSDGRFVCTCPAADNGREACWHKAAVHMVRANRLAWGLPAAGPSAGDTTAADRRLASIADLFAA